MLGISVYNLHNKGNFFKLILFLLLTLLLTYSYRCRTAMLACIILFIMLLIPKRVYTKKSLKVGIPIVLIFGGSQGAQKINEAVIGILKEKLNQKYQIVWATGPKQFDIVKEELKKSSIDIEKVQNAKILPYIYNMEEIMNISDIIVARSGAMTITEISNLGKPSILIPLPNVSQDHQLRNAEVLQKIGAAQIILNNELEKDILNKEIIEIASNKVKMKEMGEKASTKSVKNVQEKIYAEIKKIVKGGK